MRVKVSLQYVRTLDNGSEENIPLPDNYPDEVIMEVASMEEVEEVTAIAVRTDLELRGAKIPTILEFRYKAVEIGNPSSN